MRTSIQILGKYDAVHVEQLKRTQYADTQILKRFIILHFMLCRPNLQWYYMGVCILMQKKLYNQTGLLLDSQCRLRKCYPMKSTGTTFAHVFNYVPGIRMCGKVIVDQSSYGITGHLSIPKQK